MTVLGCRLKLQRAQSMENRYYKNKALSLIKQFVEKKLDNELINLKNYTFWYIDGDPNFGNGSKYADADCTKIVYAIDYLLYYEALKDENGNLLIPGYSHPYKSNFKGETIFTFKTLFGTQEIMEDRIKKFYNCYQKLGATTLLPCKTIKIGNKSESINTWKGNYKNKYKDYIYPFLLELKEYLDNKKCSDQEMQKLFEENKFYFANKTYEQYLKDFKLSDYDFSFEKDNYFYHWDKKKDTEKYKSFCKIYIDHTIEIINSRTNKMVDELTELLLKEKEFPKEYLK